MNSKGSRFLDVEVQGKTYKVKVVEYPFREGVELSCKTGKEEIHVSDLGLGLHEALRLFTNKLLTLQSLK